MDPNERPCIKVCEYEEATGWCFACGMTKPERKAWKRLPGYRAAIRQSLPARLLALTAEGHRTGLAAARGKRRLPAEA